MDILFIEDNPSDLEITLHQLQKSGFSPKWRNVISREDYIAASFSSSLFGFVDDLEIRIDSGSRVIHLRSASRVGTSDLGANSRRIHMIKKSFVENQ